MGKAPCCEYILFSLSFHLVTLSRRHPTPPVRSIGAKAINLESL